MLIALTGIMVCDLEKKTFYMISRIMSQLIHSGSLTKLISY